MPNYHTGGMRDLLIQFAHLVMTLIRPIGPGGARSIVAESLLIRHQLLIVNRPQYVYGARVATDTYNLRTTHYVSPT